MARKQVSDLDALAYSAVDRDSDLLLIKDVSTGVSKSVTPEAMEKSLCLLYVANITQSGSSAPVATVLHNTLGGTVVWTRTTTGNYVGTLASAFPITRTHCQATRHFSDSVVDDTRVGADTANTVSILQTNGGVALDGMTKLQLRVEVYPA